MITDARGVLRGLDEYDMVNRRYVFYVKGKIKNGGDYPRR